MYLFFLLLATTISLKISHFQNSSHVLSPEQYPYYMQVMGNPIYTFSQTGKNVYISIVKTGTGMWLVLQEKKKATIFQDVPYPGDSLFTKIPQVRILVKNGPAEGYYLGWKTKQLSINPEWFRVGAYALELEDAQEFNWRSTDRWCLTGDDRTTLNRKMYYRQKDNSKKMYFYFYKRSYFPGQLGNKNKVYEYFIKKSPAPIRIESSASVSYDPATKTTFYGGKFFGT
jgi:hypothetical protein